MSWRRWSRMSPLARGRRRRRPESSQRPRGSRRHHIGWDLSRRLGLSVPPDVRLSSHRLFNGHLRVCRNGRLSRRRRQNGRLQGCHNDHRHDCLNGRRHHFHLTSASSGGGARPLTRRLFHVRQRVSASGRRRRTHLMVTVVSIRVRAALGGRRRCCLQGARDLRGLHDLHLQNFLLHSNKSLTRMLRATRSSALLGGSTILRAALAIRRTLGQVPTTSPLVWAGTHPCILKHRDSVASVRMGCLVRGTTMIVYQVPLAELLVSTPLRLNGPVRARLAGVPRMHQCLDLELMTVRRLSPLDQSMLVVS
mmetsp:Transcript_18189/g.48825  ORF Transcript_18189/g.48825 Transcript_18189/m.48825 type:complete len:308 (+) Transcript_18189:173-1096(+)